MKRARVRTSSTGFSLFPFLAVLLCTVGVLIVMLVLIVQMARADVEEEGQTALVPPRDPHRVAQEDYQWRHDLLAQQRVKIQEEVAGKRLELSHLEQHIRELEQRWKELRAAASDLELRTRGQGAGQEAAQAELAQLRAEVVAAQRDLDEARERLENQPPRYAIVPYEGPHGTHRRPIYIECTAQGVTIQPEGIVLGSKDFTGPLGPGNPLDAALRGIREHYARAGTLGSEGEPYPLLIVRPDGVDAYGAAREAMRAWDDEFGYELIDQDMRMEYPESDPVLAELLRKVILDARSRQEILAAAMPSRFERQEEAGFVASATGGFVRQAVGAERPAGARVGGFGAGGDSRFVDGRAGGPVAGQSGSTQPTPAGQEAREPNSAAGTPGATLGGATTPLAKTRGRNWGLAQHAGSATGIVRPIRVACLSDRLLILPDRGESRAPDVVLVEGAMYDEVDAFVAKLWARVDTWGIAVAGGYWKPVLHVAVTPGAEPRFEELRVLLDNSGLEVQRSDK